MSFTKNIGKNISKNLSRKYSHKLLDHTKQSATDAFKTSSKRAIQKTAEAIGNLIHNKIADKITKVSKKSLRNNLETVTNENDKEISYFKKAKSTVSWTYVISDLNGEEIVRTFYAKEFQKANQKEFRIEKTIKKKSDKLYVTWKGYDNSFNSWIVKKT